VVKKSIAVGKTWRSKFVKSCSCDLSCSRFFVILAPEFIYSLREQIVCSGGDGKTVKISYFLDRNSESGFKIRL